jgi:hypothetical protein
MAAGKPVPLSVKKRHHRGINETFQTECRRWLALCNGLSTAIPWKAWTKIMLRGAM